MNIKRNYRTDAALRGSFNALAEKTFGISFENWYRLGFWGNNYEPFSLVEDGKVIANVSLNRTDMVIGGQRKRLYQLGTVMTEENCRNRGYIRAIMEKIEEATKDADGVYLFANDSVVDFYPKFGFVPGKEYVYSKSVSQQGESRMRQVVMDCAANIDRLCGAMEGNVFQTGCRMVDNNDLIFFYAAQFMQDCVFHWEEKDLWVIAELEEGQLMLHDVFCPNAISLDAVIGAFGAEVKTVTLGFAPLDTEDWDCRELKEEDTTFFVKGDFSRDFSEKKLRIPTLSHA